MGDAYVSRPLKKESKGEIFNLLQLNPLSCEVFLESSTNQNNDA